MTVLTARTRGWRARRLRAMSAGEIAARVVRSARHRADDLTWRLARPLWSRSWAPPLGHLLAGAPSTVPLGLLSAERARMVGERDPSGSAAVISLASDTCSGRVRLFGLPEAHVDPAAVATRDPFTGRAWPEHHGKRIDYRDPTLGDPKWIWELDRCQELPLLAAAWLLSGESRFAAAAAERLVSWCRAHPPGRGIAYANAFEPGIRVVSLALAYDALRPAAALDAAGRETVLTTIWQHARWILRDPSTHSSANNHRIGELVGLVAAGTLVPELADAPSWLARALPELEREAGAQVLADGTGAERAFGYHLFVLDLLLLASALLRARRLAVPRGILEALGCAADALAAEVGPGEPDPRYGDADDGRAVTLDAMDGRDARGVAASLAALLGHPGARRLAGRMDTTAWWLLGAEGGARWAAAAAAPAPGSVLLPDGGRAILRRGPVRVAMDVGPLGYLSIAAHGHADALAVDVSDGGDELVVDPGTGSYFRRPELRAAFRSTGFHATVTVDGLDQAEPGGPFLWARHVRAQPLLFDPEERVAIGEHDGYLRLPDPVSHRRAIALGDDGLVVIVDRLEARETHRYSQTWPLHPRLSVETVGEGALRCHDAFRSRLALSFASSAGGSLQVRRGYEQPLAGWWSSRFESAEPASVCSWETSAAGVVHLVAALRPAAAEAWAPLDVTLEMLGPAALVTVAARGAERRLLLDLSGRDRPHAEWLDAPATAGRELAEALG